MVQVLDKASDLMEAHRRIRKAFQISGALEMKRNVGFPGGNMDVNIRWAEEFGIWHAARVYPGDRLWNGFGTMLPEKGKSLSLVCEINFPTHGIDRRVGGVVVSDGKGRCILGHRGKIGGGKVGVSKTAFWRLFEGKSLLVLDGKQESRIAVVAGFDSPRFLAQLQAFVLDVERIRNEASTANCPVPQDGGTASMAPHGKFQVQAVGDEFAGTKEYTIRRKILAECNHGLIVKALRRGLERLGYQVGKDQYRDLYVHKNGKVTALFEVKPSLDRQSVYSAIGQLIVHSSDLVPRPKLYFVAPEGLGEGLVKAFRGVGISVLELQWEGDTPTFPGLSKEF